MTQKQERMLWSYNRATATELRQAYGRYSEKKLDAMNRCKAKQLALNGYDGRITSANSYRFAYAFKFRAKDGRECLCYITRNNNYIFPIQ